MASRRGRKPHITDATRRRIIREVKKHPHSGVRKIAQELNEDASRMTVWRTVRAANMRRRRPRLRPRLTPRHIDARLVFATELLQRGADLPRIIFTDEKKFNLDGPDGYRYLWWEQGRSLPEDTFSADSFGKRGVIVHLAFSRQGIVSCVRMHGSVTGSSYAELLQSRVFPAARARHRDGFIYQHDNAPAHASHLVRDLFDRDEIELLSWPALSPDLNPVENLWSIIAQRVYASEAAHANEDALWEAVFRETWHIERSLLRRLVDGIPARLCQLVRRGGKYVQ